MHGIGEQCAASFASQGLGMDSLPAASWQGVWSGSALPFSSPPPPLRAWALMVSISVKRSLGN